MAYFRVSLFLGMAYFRVSFLLGLLIMPTTSADPDPLQDFCVADISSSNIFMNGLPCINSSEASADHSTTSILSREGNTSANIFGLSVISATVDVLPGINTQGIIIARVDLAVGGLLPPHTHPRATEIVYVLEGKLNVGFIDTNNKLFSAEIKKGDVFVFPKALLHYAQNIGNDTVSLISALNSQNPGIQTIPLSAFASNPAIPSSVLAKSFQIDVTEVETIRKKLSN